MAFEDEFEQAVARAKGIGMQSPDVLLQLYGLYKQATAGDVIGERPGGFDFKGAAKFDAWSKQRGKSPDDARKEYVELVQRLAAG